MPHKALQKSHTKGRVNHLNLSDLSSNLLLLSPATFWLASYTPSLAFVLPFMHEVDPRKGQIITKKRC